MGFIKSDQRFWWRGGVVPYIIDDDDFPVGHDRNQIEKAIAAWNDNSFMRLIERSDQLDYLVFIRHPTSCKTRVGRQGGPQKVRCFIDAGNSSAFTAGNVMHELGHSFGFFHEHQRPGRDTRVHVDGSLEEDVNFKMLEDENPITDYDCGSIMHYPAVTDSLSLVFGQCPGGIGQRIRPSSLDSNTVRMMLDPYPGPAVSSGTWGSIGVGHELFYLSNGKVLDWDSTTGDCRVWNVDFNSANDPLPTLHSEGSLNRRSGQRLVRLGSSSSDGGERILDWIPSTGEYRLWSLRAGEAPLFSGPISSGSWSSIRSGHELVYLGEYLVLDWEPATGDYRTWNFDVQSTGDPFPGPPVHEGNWSTIRTGHQLLGLEDRKVLDWVPNTGDFRIWNFDPLATDPLPGRSLVDSNWLGIRTGHRLVQLDFAHLLDWEPASGNFNLWKFDRSRLLPTLLS